MLKPGRAALWGAVAGVAIFFLVVQPIIVGGVDLPLEQRVLVGVGSLIASVVTGALLGYLVARAVRRRERDEPDQ
jgi:hypothetical protein